MTSEPGITIGVNTWGLRITEGFSPSARPGSPFSEFSSAVSELGAWVGLGVVSCEEAGFRVGTVGVIFWGDGVGFGFLTLGVVFGFLVEVGVLGALVGFEG